MSPRQRGPQPHRGGPQPQPQQQRGPASSVAGGPPAPLPAPDECATLTPLIAAIEKIRNSRVIVYWTSPAAKVSAGVAMSLYDQLVAIGKTERIDLVLLTNGGDTDAPWRIVSLIREFCDHFGVLLPHQAMSAGTAISLGANEIIMTPLSVLGPIDPSRSHPLLPRREGSEEAEPISVQDMRHAMKFIREAAGSDKEMPYTPEAMAQIFTALFEKIHPLAIGAIEQSYALSKLVGKQCLGTHMDPVNDKEKISAIVDKLCDDFKYHGYQIGRKEARQVGLNAVDAPDDVDLALRNLFMFYAKRPMTPDPFPRSGNFFNHIAWLDSTALRFRCVSQNVIDGDNAKFVGDQWLAYSDPEPEAKETAPEGGEAG